MPRYARGAFGGGKETGQYAHGGAFARTVGADEADNFASLHSEREILNSRLAPVEFGEVLHLNHGLPIVFVFRHYRIFTLAIPVRRCRKAPRRISQTTLSFTMAPALRL